MPKWELVNSNRTATSWRKRAVVKLTRKRPESKGIR